ncbi:hypothetical protein SAMN05443572_101350 [Myxococcus fulvus]|uniref:Uncharacterized protein n=1 Tax=Myxococcus fulvus TaxID=33 RepID=A0A511T0E4_MYXFU|nr:hypothetical protein [Myxococcus fulvus]AKF79302.1 hypothetical protein MFUL124B02_02630 [Myxococcus fulvus 124B02]GEN07636.1 hypothetical protein MFU01_26730 [Myxococcus fulvus]SES84507.1 hypothetical protein SAMN05443572_101350 [Myxococcus fulvus]
MSKKDVLNIPTENLPTIPKRDAGAEDEATRRAPKTLDPHTGPGGTPGVDDTPRIIEPKTTPGRYPGVSVS